MIHVEFRIQCFIYLTKPSCVDPVHVLTWAGAANNRLFKPEAQFLHVEEVFFLSQETSRRSSKPKATWIKF